MTLLERLRAQNRPGHARGQKAPVLWGWLRPVAAALVVALALIRMDPSSLVDRSISDRMLVGQMHAADPAVMIVEITPEDARKYNGPPFNRQLFARMLDNLAGGGAGRVLLDIHFGAALVPADDAALAAAMARLGPQRLGLVTANRPDQLPLDMFARHAAIVDARLTPDQDGRHRSMGAANIERGFNAARWLGTGTLSKDPVLFDLRVQPGQFSRVSMDDVLTGKADPRGRLVVVTLSTQLSPSRAFLPSLAGSDRGATLALAAQSARANFGADHGWARLLETGVVALAMLIGLLCAVAARSWLRLLIYAICALIILCTACLTIGFSFASAVSPSHVISSFMIFLNLSLLHRLGILPMIASFMRGDISPDEAWAWRTLEASQHPAFLFGFNGRVKRSNAAGTEILAGYADALAQLAILPRGEGGDSLVLPNGGRGERSFQVDWPFEQLPLMVLRDVTETETAQRQLEAQLKTDPLTGRANRRGFDEALFEAAESGEGYSVLFIDMNGFKAVNDTHGHDAGDELLVVIANRMAGLLRSGDTLARLGGDEFAIIARSLTSSEAALALKARFTQAIARPVKLSCVDATVEVGAAIGFAVADSGQHQAEALVRAADQAMYRDKRASKLSAAA